MKFTIVTTVLLGLLLTPALADTDLNTEGNQHSNGNDQYIDEPVLSNQVLTKQVSIDGGYQTLTLQKQRRVAIVQQESTQGSWEIVWNYNSDVVATRILPERVCYISKVNRMELPRFDELPKLAEEIMSVKGQGQPAREMTFVIQRRIRDLRSFGQDIFALCRGLPTYETYEVRGSEYQYNEGSCLTLDVLQLLELQFCQEFDQSVKQDLVSN